MAIINFENIAYDITWISCTNCTHEVSLLAAGWSLPPELWHMPPNYEVNADRASLVWIVHQGTCKGSRRDRQPLETEINRLTATLLLSTTVPHVVYDKTNHNRQDLRLHGSSINSCTILQDVVNCWTVTILAHCALTDAKKMNICFQITILPAYCENIPANSTGKILTQRCFR